MYGNRLTTLWSAVICLVSPLKKVTLTVSPSAETSFLVPLGKAIRRSPPARTFSICEDHNHSSRQKQQNNKQTRGKTTSLYWLKWHLDSIERWTNTLLFLVTSCDLLTRKTIKYCHIYPLRSKIRSTDKAAISVFRISTFSPSHQGVW